MAHIWKRNIVIVAKCAVAAGISYYPLSKFETNTQSLCTPSLIKRLNLRLPVTYCEGFGDSTRIEVPQPAGFQQNEDYITLWNYQAFLSKCIDLAIRNVEVILDEVDSNPNEYPAFAEASRNFDNMFILAKYFRQAKGFVGLNIDIVKIGVTVHDHFNTVSKPFQALNDDQKLTIVNRGVFVHNSYVNKDAVEDVVYQLDSIMALTVIELVKAEIKHLSNCFGNMDVEEELMFAAERHFVFLNGEEDEEEDEEAEGEEEEEGGNGDE